VDIWNLHINPQSPLYQILLGSAVITTVINITWFIISSCLAFVAHRVHLRVKSHQFVLGQGVTRAKYEALFRNISSFHCLLVRYGTDDYIIKMASDRERFEGRQQLKVLPITVAFDADDRAIFTLKLPIHKSLGTQFKCFAEARSVAQVPAVIAALKECEHARCVKQSDSYKRTRVYFLLDHFVAMDTINAEVQNNYIYPE
jgi:hypothetical protein